MPDVASLVQTHGYWILGLLIMLENMGIPLPGETALLAAGYMSSSDGGQHLDLWAVVLVAFLAAVIGDNLGFWLGRRVARPRLASGRGFLFLTPARMQIAERYFEKYGALTVLVARFITGLRVIAGPAAGAAGMQWPRFLTANAAGALCWVIVIAIIGRTAGHTWEALKTQFGYGTWIILAVIVVAVIIWRVRAYRRRRRIPDTGDTQQAGSVSDGLQQQPVDDTKRLNP